MDSSRNRREELVRHVVVVAHRAPVARVAVAPPAGAQLRRRCARQRAQGSGPNRSGGQPQPAARVDRRRLPAVQEDQRGIDVIDLDAARSRTRARAPSWPGARSMCPSAAGEASLNVGPDPLVGGQGGPVPQLDGERALGESRGQGRAQGRRGGAGAHRAALPASFAACRSGGTRTTSHARPSSSSTRMNAAEGSTSQRRRPCAAEVGKA